MLTKEQYKLLCDLRDKMDIDEDKHFVVLEGLKKLGYARSTSYKPYDAIWDRICGFVITENGKAAIEEYEKSLRKESREIESLNVARSARNLSIAAIVVSTLASIAAILVSCLVK